MLSGIICINRNGLRWRFKTLCNRWKRWSEKDVFARMTISPTARRDQHGREKGGFGRLVGRTKGGMNIKLHPIWDSQGRLIDLFITAGTGERLHRCAGAPQWPAEVDRLLGDRGYDADWFRKALQEAYAPASPEGSNARHPSDKIDTATASRSCSAGSQGPEARRHPRRSLPQSPLQNRAPDRGHGQSITWPRYRHRCQPRLARRSLRPRWYGAECRTLRRLYRRARSCPETRSRHLLLRLLPRSRPKSSCGKAALSQGVDVETCPRWSKMRKRLLDLIRAQQTPGTAAIFEGVDYPR